MLTQRNWRLPAAKHLNGIEHPMSQLQKTSDGLLFFSVALAGLVINRGPNAETFVVWGLAGYFAIATTLYVLAEKQRQRSQTASDSDNDASDGRLSDQQLRLLMVLGMPLGFFFVSWQYAVGGVPHWIALVTGSVSAVWGFLTGMSAFRSLR